jgi:preprotein translocase subunit YajC
MVTETFWIYLILVFALLIILAIIWIAIEQRAYRRYQERLKKLKKNAELRIIG